MDTSKTTRIKKIKRPENANTITMTNIVVINNRHYFSIAEAARHLQVDARVLDEFARAYGYDLIIEDDVLSCNPNPVD